MRKTTEGAQPILWLTLILVLLGLVMTYSASIALGDHGNSTNRYLIRQSLALLLGLVLCVALFRIELNRWQRWAPWLFLLGLLLLVTPLIPGLSHPVNGARRWLQLPGFTVQPSEFMKLFAVLYCADYTVRKLPHMHQEHKALLPMMMAMILVGALLLAEPDFGAFAIIAMMAAGVLFAGGLRLRSLIGMGLIMTIVFAILIASSAYRRQRLLGFLDPWSDPYGQGYQLTHSLMAFGRGEWFGVGLGASVEKLAYLPEAHTDFLLAVVGEELGFVGVLIILSLYGYLIYRIFLVGRQAALLERFFPALLAEGIGIWLAAQALVNIGVNLGWLPTKGLTLPLMSYGSNSLLVTLLAIALVLRVDYENRHPYRQVSLDDLNHQGTLHSAMTTAGNIGGARQFMDRRART